MDLLINLAHLDPWASHLGKREALNIPLLKYAILPLQFILVGRDKKDSKAQREKLLADVAE